jgi:F-type H+-transporting ATPase subunit epsilon
VSEALHLRVVTPTRVLVSDAVVDVVTVPGALGEIGILPGHTPLLASLGIGPLAYRQGKTATAMAIFRGFVEVSGTTVTVLADAAELPEEIDVDAAKAAGAAAEDAMRTAAGEEQTAAREQLESATVRLAVAASR